MDGGRYGLALTAGMLATINPCGLPMLPAYLSFFISRDDGERRGDLNAVMRAVGVAGVVALGFMSVFAVVGGVVNWVTRDVYKITPWISVGIGALLVAVGIALLAGRQLTISLPKLDRGGRTRGLGSMFVFGVSYAIASVSCTLPVYLTQVPYSAHDAHGLTGFVFYGAGVTIVLVALSVSLGLARTEVVNALRRSLRVINRVAGGFLVIAGLYIAWYSVYEIRNRSDSDPAVDRVTGWSSDLGNRLQNIGAIPLALALLVVIGGVIGIAYLRAARPASEPTEVDTDP